MKETAMDRLFANGTVNAAQSGQGSGKAPVLFPVSLAAVGPGEFRRHHSKAVAVVPRHRTGIAGLRRLEARQRGG